LSAPPAFVAARPQKRNRPADIDGGVFFVQVFRAWSLSVVAPRLFFAEQLKFKFADEGFQFLVGADDRYASRDLQKTSFDANVYSLCHDPSPLVPVIEAACAGVSSSRVPFPKAISFYPGNLQ
jgi:hypothetical protein